MKKYFKVWWIFAVNSFQSQAANRFGMIIFMLGKILRFGIFGFFIITLLSKTSSLAGYSLNQTLFFFLTFNLVDLLAQLFFREVYRFRPSVVSGAFDFSLIKPISPLFRSLTAGPDLLDFLMLIPLTFAIVYYGNNLGNLELINIFYYIVLIIVGFIISLSFHILVLSLAVSTTEIDHAVMIYRDITGIGRMPIDIFKEPLRGLLTFVIPVGMMMSFPVKSLLGLLSPLLIVYSIIFSLFLFLISLKVWQYCLKQYSSASS